MEFSKTPIEDLVKDALKHYDKLSKECGEWNGLIPKALKYYEKQKDNTKEIKLQKISNYIMTHFEYESGAYNKLIMMIKEYKENDEN